MKLLFEESACTTCGACLSVCPKGPKSTGLLKCRHCAPEGAPCKVSCPLGAIKQSSELLFVDLEECSGCGECVNKCPYGAIEIVNGKASKCDACLGEPKCIDYCPEEAIRPLKHEDGVLGWEITREKAGYSLGLPRLSKEEESIVAEVASRFREASKKGEFPGKNDAKKEIESILTSYCQDYGLRMETDQFEYLSEISLAQVWGFGPLEPLLEDEGLEEIAIIGLGKPIYVYKRGCGWLETDCMFSSQEVFINIVNKMARPLGRRLTYQTPRLNAVLPNGSRLHASMPPISDLELIIRKFRANPISVPELISLGTFSPESLAFLWLAMKVDTSVVVAGNTASGKTSTLNALFSFVPLGERVLITEETPEINIPHRHRVKLLANTELGIGMGELASDSLIMRPDRLIVGEAKTEKEAKALLDAITSGQARGSYATFHAHSAKEAVARMRSLGAPEADISSIGLIVIQKRLGGSKKNSEARKALEIAEVKLEGGASEAVLVYEYDYKTRSLKRTKNESRTERTIMNALSLGKMEFKTVLRERAGFLTGLAKRKT
ncbi:MAG: ATPase, T2SS/T4P/T4SS family, partial [Candidatus Micrarchaeota archaeon]